MSKLIWWVSVIIVALLNGVRPVIMSETPLIVNGYYTSTLGVEDPAAIYQSLYSMGDWGDNPPCDTVPREPNLETGPFKDKEVLWVTQTKAFLLLGDSEAIPTGDEWQLTNESTDDETLIPIIAPFPAVIETSPTNSNYSTEMIVHDAFNPNLKLKISNMTKWYCCTSHGRNASGHYQHIGVNNNSYDRTIQAGFILGYANKDTKCSFVQDGTSISFDTFYYGNDKDGKPLKDTFSKCVLDANKPEEEEKQS